MLSPSRRAAASLALISSGSVNTVYAWGDNQYGQLGNTGGMSSIPEPVYGLGNVVAIAMGGAHALAVVSGTNVSPYSVWAWGDNEYGQLGLNPFTYPYPGMSPTPVNTINTQWVVAIAGGGYHSLAVMYTGVDEASAWGSNQYGQLGEGCSYITCDEPVSIPGPPFDLDSVTAVAGGQFHSIALSGYGTVWDWGDNQYGQLGNGSTVNSSQPVQVSGLSNVIAIAAGWSHSVAVEGDGTVWTWGYNGYGQLGSGTTQDAPSPTQVNLETFSDTFTSTGNGTITSNASTVSYGGSVTFTITPSVGYHLSSLTDNGMNVTTAASWNGSYYTYTISGITSNNTVQATFAPGSPPPPAAPALSMLAGIFLAAAALGVILWVRRKVNA